MTKNKTITPTKLIGSIHPPLSKAVSHRTWIISGFGEPGSRISKILNSQDTKATRNAMIQMGAEYRLLASTDYRLVKRANHAPGEVDCKNSGTTLRLITGVAALFSGDTTLFGDESLMSRPMGHLLDALSQLGVESTSENGKPPISVRKPVDPDRTKTTITGDTSSQFISSLLIMSALRDGITTEIQLIPPVVSKPYIDLTIQMLRSQGVKIIEQNYSLKVTGVLNFGEVNIIVPSDMSSVAFYAVAAAFPGNQITFFNISNDFPQADSKILEIIENAGAKVEYSGTQVTISGSNLKGIEYDISQCPDLFPILCVLAANSVGKSKYYNAKHLRIKETDRIMASLSNLEKVGIKYEELDDGAIIYGGEVKGNVELESFSDHRIEMAAVILATIASDPITIKNAYHVDVSYPGFYIDFERLSKNK